MHENISVVLVNTRFPENIGMVARACANMGVKKLCLVNPEMWVMEKARPLATERGKAILEGITFFNTLAEALQNCNLAIATTARIGGWRKNIINPRQMAEIVFTETHINSEIALVFGPEDKGLDNEDIMLCQQLVKIPTALEASSLNIAQAVLILLYECFTLSQSINLIPKKPSILITNGDNERLMQALKTALLQIDFLQPSNPDYFFMPLRRLFARKGIKKPEYNALMGICRQIMIMCKK